MKIKIENIECIEEAEIELEGLTVLSGLNQTGKSLAMRIVFTVLEDLHTTIRSGSNLAEIKINLERCLAVHFNSLNLSKGKITITSLQKEELFCFCLDSHKLSVAGEGIQKVQDILGSSTYIENPLIIEDFNFIRSSILRLARDNYGLPFRLKDLSYNKENIISKLQTNAEIECDIQDDILSVYNRIKEIIKGEVIYDLTLDGYVFKREGIEKLISIKHIPSSIKVFCLLQALIKARSITSGSTLIIDNPELYLHPKWQVEYAKVLVILAEAGVKVMISSHSPYMLEAIYTYANRSRILKDEFRLHYFEKDTENDKSILRNITNQDPFLIFEEMSNAMDSISNTWCYIS